MIDALPPQHSATGTNFTTDSFPSHTATFNGAGATLSPPSQIYMAKSPRHPVSNSPAGNGMPGYPPHFKDKVSNAGQVPGQNYIPQAQPGRQPQSVNGFPTGNGLTGQQPPLNDQSGNTDPVSVQNNIPQAQPEPQPQSVNGFPADNGLTKQQPSLKNQSAHANPEINTSGAKKAEEPPATDEELEKMSDIELEKEGEKRLESAKKAYTKHGQFNIALQAQKTLKLFINACTDFGGKASELFSKLQGISFPEGVPKDLSVMIKYPNDPSFSLIPPDEKHLSSASIEDITKWYMLADQAMGGWSQANMKGANELSSAKRDLDDTLLALKAIRQAIDDRHKKKTGFVGNSQLEVLYQKHLERGVTINFEAEDARLESSTGKKPEGQIS